MSNYSHEEQVQIVKKAMELESAIQSETKLKNALRNEDFRNPPKAPVRKTVNMNVKPIAPDYSNLPRVNMTFTDYLEIDARSKPTILNKIFSKEPVKRGLIVFGVLLFLTVIFSTINFWTLSRYSVIDVLSTVFPILAFLCFVGTLVYSLKKNSDYTQRKYQLTQDLLQQPHYLQAKAEAERAAVNKQAAIIINLKNQQAEFDKQYAEQKNHYDTVIMVQYNQERSKWAEENSQKIDTVTNKLESDRKEQTELYETTKLIPIQYRDIKALTYLYQLMSTSEYDIKEAIDMYNREIERQLNAMRIREQQRANDLADEQNELQNELNELQYQQNIIAEKQRKDDRRREIETEYHRHQIRKNLKSNK